MSYNSVEDYMQNAENNRNSAVLKTLLEDEPGMRELPNITDNDIGKYLKVKSDKSLEWAEGGSSGGGLLVTVTWNEDYDEADLDKTWQEIHDAIVAGKYVSFNEPYSGEGESYINVYHIAGINVDESNSKPYGVWIDNHSDMYSFLSETTSGTLHYEPIELPDGGLTDH